ncbi:MAG: class I SAM-dependent methyltransferase [Haloarculaceae archaeon]
MPTPFASAIQDHARDDRTDPLIQRDGEHAREHPIEDFYFGTASPDQNRAAFFAEHLEGPLVDLGAGAGKDALWFQERFQTVALEVADPLVEVMRDRGVEQAVQGDMFELRATFEGDRFASALSFGTQLGLAKSMAGLRAFFEDLAVVTTGDATAIVDGYDPTHPDASDLLGYRADETEGLAYRVMHFEYDGEVGETLLFRLFSPDRLAAAAADAGWRIETVRRAGGEHYEAVLQKV